MATCANCRTIVLFGGYKVAGNVYCKEECFHEAVINETAELLPVDAVEQATHDVYHGDCPQCGGEGPIDVHTSQRIWSAVVFARTSSSMRICCRRCAREQLMKDGLITLLLGWWCIPPGVICTPIYLVRTLLALARLGGSTGPSRELLEHVRANMAAAVASAPPAEVFDLNSIRVA